MAEERWRRRETARLEARRVLREKLSSLARNGTRFWVYGSLTKPGRFHENSDIDLAVEDPESVVNLARVQNAISEATGRESDVVRMEETRLAGRIRRDGELWTV